MTLKVRTELALGLMLCTLGCSQIVHSPDAGADVDAGVLPKDFMPFVPGAVWQYDETGTLRLQGSWKGRVALRVESFDEGTGIAEVGVFEATDARCSTRRFSLRKTPVGGIQFSQGGGDWRVVFDPVGGPSSEVTLLLSGSGFLAVGGAETPLLDLTTVETPMGSFDDATQERWSQSPLGVYDSAWVEGVGEISESVTMSPVGLSRTYLLVGYLIPHYGDSPERRAGALPDEASPLPPLDFAVQRVGPTEALLRWTDCGLGNSTTVIERSCGLDGTYQVLARVQGSNATYSDTTATSEECIYRLLAENTAGRSDAGEPFTIGPDGAPPTPLRPWLVESNTWGGPTALAISAWTYGGAVTGGRVEWSDGTIWRAVDGVVPTTQTSDGGVLLSTTLFYTDGGVLTQSLSATATDWPAGTYMFRMSAQRDGTASPFSPAASITTRAP